MPARYFTHFPALFLLLLPQVASSQEPLFPFVLSGSEADSATNISSWLEKPAGKSGFIRAQGAQFVTDRGPIRFFGTNLCFDACFPTHQQSERLARQLAGFGINVVRMHHMDSHSIWGKSRNHLEIDPQRLERLDYLIWQLKQQGIYTNLNLHVSRWFGPEDGFTEPEGRPNYDKGLDNFEPRMIELQKQYARDLLTHVNPYTGSAYAHEPAIAFVEINNENALFDQWSHGGLDALPEPYATTFREQWNNWLRKKYGTTEKLRVAWSGGEQPLGTELLTNGEFTAPINEAWNLELDSPTDVAQSVRRGDDGQPYLRIEVRRPGQVSWRPQLSQAGFTVKKGAVYTLSFRLRAEGAENLFVNCMMAHEPWQNLGLGQRIELTPDWRTCELTFVADRDDANARVTWTNLTVASYELAKVSLRPGGVEGLRESERLEDGSVAVLTHGQRGRTPAMRKDFIDFMWDTEHQYWLGMYQFLKSELGLQPPVSGTQLGYSPVHIQAQLDFIDAHSYWQHPDFPRRPWDPNDWYVNNVAMVNTLGGTLINLAGRQVMDKPFTVSEYNHPQPNQYGAEGIPMLAAFAALQQWDAIYNFTWSHDTNFEPRRLTGYFDFKADAARLVHFPASAALFLRGDMASAQRTIRVPLSAGKERAQLHETLNPWSLNATDLGIDRNQSLRHRVAIDRDLDTAPPTAGTDNSESTVTSDNAALRWDLSRPDRGFFAVDTPRTKLFTGFPDGRPINLGKIQLDIDSPTLGWATVSLTCLDGDGFEAAGRVLIAATGAEQNTGWQWEELGQRRVTLRSGWGRDPLLCEGINATISLPVEANRLEVYALDAAGNRGSKLQVERSATGTAIVVIGAPWKTLWYEAVMK